jgi:class 3 adenylate cyclase
MIGDEAMFVADRTDDAARIATRLCSAAQQDPCLPAARGAVGVGHVSTWGGDYFGPLVNAVARATKAASPGRVVALAPADAALVASGWALAEPEVVELRGVDDRAVVVEIVGPPEDPSSHAPARRSDLEVEAFE